MDVNVLSPHDAAKLVSLENAVVADCRFFLESPERGFDEYLKAHLPHAQYVHLDRDLSDMSRRGAAGRHPLPTAASFSALLSRMGLTHDRWLLVYDQGGGMFAARLWWLARAAGHARVALINGGLATWLAQGLPVTEKTLQAEASNYAVEFDAKCCVEAEEIEKLRVDPSFLLLDARAAARFTGELVSMDPIAGHVPGAQNRPYAFNLDASGALKPVSLLREEFSALLQGRKPEQVVHMCGSGVTSCLNLLVMEHIGLSGSRLYVGSWSEWISDPERPIAKAFD